MARQADRMQVFISIAFSSGKKCNDELTVCPKIPRPLHDCIRFSDRLREDHGESTYGLRSNGLDRLNVNGKRTPSSVRLIDCQVKLLSPTGVTTLTALLSLPSRTSRGLDDPLRAVLGPYVFAEAALGIEMPRDDLAPLGVPADDLAAGERGFAVLGDHVGVLMKFRCASTRSAAAGAGLWRRAPSRR